MAPQTALEEIESDVLEEFSQLVNHAIDTTLAPLPTGAALIIASYDEDDETNALCDIHGFDEDIVTGLLATLTGQIEQGDIRLLSIIRTAVGILNEIYDLDELVNCGLKRKFN